MNKTSIKKQLKEAIRDGWIQFVDPTDKKYFLSINDLDELFDQLSVTELIQGGDLIQDLEEEYNSL